jgi:tRNA/rRNA methyltransferase
VENFPQTEAINRGQLEAFLLRLESELESKGFFLTSDMKPHSAKTLRSIFSKARLNDSEVKMLHGVLTALTSPGSIGSVSDAAE